jgi:hypothetical protein
VPSTLTRLLRLARPLLLIATVAIALLAVPGAATAKDKTTWLCNPSQKKDPCRIDLTATVQKSDGTQTTEKRKNARNPKIDCFYVYPTVSDQQKMNADLSKDPEIVAIAKYQAARFSQTCRVWAPVYKQLTLKGISDPSKITAANRAKAYNSMLSAWHEYLKKHNKGRGFVLLGHSQGSFLLRQLIKDEIDRRPKLRFRMVSAIIPGGDVVVRKGRDVGGDFDHVRACRTTDQLACVVAYSAYGEDPPAESRFARVSGKAAKTQEILCTNPAALARGDKGNLLPYVSTEPFPGTIGLAVRIFIGELPDVPTPWLRPPGRYSAQCKNKGGAQFLKIASLDGARAPTPTPDANWGYHLGDVNLPMGNLTDLVRLEAESYARMLVAE